MVRGWQTAAFRGNIARADPSQAMKAASGENEGRARGVDEMQA
jgi:hypothetical protein